LLPIVRINDDLGQMLVLLARHVGGMRAGLLRIDVSHQAAADEVGFECSFLTMTFQKLPISRALT
jgi:hypothetical protein